MSQEKPEEEVFLDCWGLITPDNVQALQERTDKWKPSLLALAKEMNQAMTLYRANYSASHLRPQWFIMNGTLLGAYRNGKMIPHDYDFDYGICFFAEDGKMANLDQSSKEELIKIARYLSDSLNKIYTVKAINDHDYTCKIQVYQKSSGFFGEDESNCHNVHLDLQLCYTPDGQKLKVACLHDYDHFCITVPSVFPLSEIEFESTKWPSPNDPRVMLDAMYGYIGTPAKFNPKTMKYEPL